MKIPGHYEFFSQHKVISGNKSMEHIPIELESFNAMKPLVITNQSSTKAGIVSKFKKAMFDSKLIIGGIFNDSPDYASFGTIEKCVELFRARGCDSIISLGSGSIMDIAKGVNIVVSENTDKLFDFAGKDKITGICKPLISIPTATINGLEQTNTAEIDKHYFSSDYLYPDVICIDPRVVKGCCSQCVAESAIIALTQAIEASDEPYDNPMNDAYSHPSIQLVFENFKKGIKKPKNKQTSMSIANAAAIAGIAFANSPSGLVFNTAKAVETVTGHSRGKIMSIMLPIWLESKIENNEIFRDELLLALQGFEIFSKTSKDKRAALSLKLIKSAIKKQKKYFPKNLNELNIPKYLFDEIASVATPKDTKRYKIQESLSILETAYDSK